MLSCRFWVHARDLDTLALLTELVYQFAQMVIDCVLNLLAMSLILSETYFVLVLPLED